MAQFNYFGSGNPSDVPSPASALSNYFDTLNNALWLSSGNGWFPEAGTLVNKTVQSAISAEAATVTYPVLVTGLYELYAYEVATTATSGTLPTITAGWTEADSDTSKTDAFLADAATSAAGTINQGSLIVNALAGTNITLTASNYATATYTYKTRIQYLG